MIIVDLRKTSYITCPSAWVATNPLCDNRGVGILFSWLHIYTYILWYIYIYIYNIYIYKYIYAYITKSIVRGKQSDGTFFSWLFSSIHKYVDIYILSIYLNIFIHVLYAYRCIYNIFYIYIYNKTFIYSKVILWFLLKPSKAQRLEESEVKLLNK